MDMLRFQKFTIGWAWASDYGSSDDAEQFKTLYAYSPLHHLRAWACITRRHWSRPRTTTTAWCRRTATSSRRRSRPDQGGDAPVLIRIETKSGHGAGRPTSKLIEEVADRWAFLSRRSGWTRRRNRNQRSAPTMNAISRLPVLRTPSP